MTRQYPKFAELLFEHLGPALNNQTELAKKLGLSSKTISTWINEKARPRSAARVICIAGHLELDKQQCVNLLKAAEWNFTKQRAEELNEDARKELLEHQNRLIKINNKYEAGEKLPDKIQQDISFIQMALSFLEETQWLKEPKLPQSPVAFPRVHEPDLFSNQPAVDRRILTTDEPPRSSKADIVENILPSNLATKELAGVMSGMSQEMRHLANRIATVYVNNNDDEKLKDLYIKPLEIFERTSRFRFTGREWLLAKIDKFLEEKDRGYFVLEANAGLGKTAFLAWLVQEREYVHHFCELSPGVDGITDGLRSIAAQLAIRYGLGADKLRYTETSRSDYLYSFLNEAAQQSEGEKIIVVVDALDESDALGNGNVMGLPTDLPKGVYFIVSQRPATLRLNIKDSTTTACVYCELVAESEENQADMLSFLEYASALPEISRALQQSEHQYMPEQFITTLMEKCRGVWIYLYFVIQEIKKGDRSPLDLNALPNGMTEYYARHWRQLREADEERWDRVFLPILTTLSAAQEAVSCQQLIEWSGADISERGLNRLLGEKWRPFMVISGNGLQARYRFYHATLQEFFDGKLDQNNLSTADRAMIKELSEETRMCHHRLADRYLKAWGGWERKLEGLREEELRDMDEGYGLRHLVVHLEASGRVTELHQLLKVEWILYQKPVASFKGKARYKSWSRRAAVGVDDGCINIWYTVKDSVGQGSGYLADVRRAWQLAENRVLNRADIELSGISSATREEWLDQCIGLQCRYALILASLNSRADKLWPELLIELIKKDIWLAQQGAVYARQVTSVDKQVQMLAVLIPILSESEKRKILQEAFLLAYTIADKETRASALASLAPYLSPEQRQEILSLLQSINNSNRRATILTKLAPYLSSAQQQEIFLLTIAMTGNPDQTTILASLVPYLSSEQRQEVISLIIARTDTTARATILVGLAPYLSTEQRQELLSLARSIKSKNSQAIILAGLAPYLSTEQRQELLSLARSIIISEPSELTNLASYLSSEQLLNTLAYTCFINDNLARDKALGSLIPYFSPDRLQEALSFARNIGYSFYFATGLVGLARHLSPDQLQEVFALARSITHNSDRQTAIVGLIPYLSPEHRQEAILSISSALRWVPISTLVNTARYLSLEERQKVFMLICSFRDSTTKVDALVSMSRYLSPAQRQEILALAYALEHTATKVDALARLSRYLPPVQRQEILALVYSIEDTATQARALIKLFPLLSSAQKQEVFTTVCAIKDSSVRNSALVKLVPNLQRAQLLEILSLTYISSSLFVKILVAIARYGDQHQRQDIFLRVCSHEDSNFRVSTLVDLAPYLSLDQLSEVCSMVCSIEHTSDRGEKLLRLLPYLMRLSKTDLYNLWLGKLLTLSRRSRNDLLADLEILGCLIGYLGGTSAIAETAQAIEDVGRWWP